MQPPEPDYRDPAQWGEPQPAPKRRRRLASMFSVRLAPAEADAIRQAAQRAGLSVSAFLRRSALDAAEPMDVDRPGIQVRIISAPPGATFGGGNATT